MAQTELLSKKKIVEIPLELINSSELKTRQVDDITVNSYKLMGGIRDFIPKAMLWEFYITGKVASEGEVVFSQNSTYSMISKRPSIHSSFQSIARSFPLKYVISQFPTSPCSNFKASLTPFGIVVLMDSEPSRCLTIFERIDDLGILTLFELSFFNGINVVSLCDYILDNFLKRQNYPVFAKTRCRQSQINFGFSCRKILRRLKDRMKPKPSARDWLDAFSKWPKIPVSQCHRGKICNLMFW